MMETKTEVFKQLQSFLIGKKLTDIPDPLTFLEALSKPSYLNALLLEFIDNNQMLSDLANRSYRHENDFDRIDLIQNSRDEVGLRLHIWDSISKGSSPHSSDMHNHCWDFYSCIITGNLLVKHYDAINNGTYWGYQHGYISSKEVLELHQMGTYTLNLMYENKLTKSNMYYLNKNVIHSVEPIQGMFTVTLVLRGEYQRDFTYIFTPENTKFIQDEKLTYDPITLRKKLKEVINLNKKETNNNE